jgi:predicted nucleotidyltransferase
MRLNQEQINTLIHAARTYFGDTAQIWLFGSRIDDTKTGGDIDLYIETDLASGTVAAKIEMLCSLWSMFGEQKIDLLVRKRSQKSSAMHEIAKSSGKELLYQK